jgi:hypothetical protein
MSYGNLGTDVDCAICGWHIGTGNVGGLAWCTRCARSVTNAACSHRYGVALGGLIALGIAAVVAWLLFG